VECFRSFFAFCQVLAQWPQLAYFSCLCNHVVDRPLCHRPAALRCESVGRGIVLLTVIKRECSILRAGPRNV
jgi:hypothetical protein